MAKIEIIDLTRKPHLYCLADGSYLSVGARSKATVDESLITDLIKNEHKARVIALRKVPETMPIAHVETPVSTVENDGFESGDKRSSKQQSTKVKKVAKN